MSSTSRLIALCVGRVREHVPLRKEFSLVQVLDALPVLLLVVDEDGNVQVGLGADQGHESWNLVRTSNRSNGPRGVQPRPAVFLEKSRQSLNVQKIRHSLDNETIRSDKERLVDFIAESTLERE